MVKIILVGLTVWESIMPKRALSTSRAIPVILLPYFRAIADESTKEEWLNSIYHDFILPYVKHHLENFLFENEAFQEKNALLLVSFLKKEKINYQAKSAAKLITLQNKINNPSLLFISIENSFYRNIFYKSNGFTSDSFLPITLSAHLRLILEKQLLISLNDKLSELKISKSPDLQKTQAWLSREITNRALGIQSPDEHQGGDFTHVYPNESYYFFNGASHIFVFCQLEYRSIKNMGKNWFDLVEQIKRNEHNVAQFLNLLVMSSIKFLFNIFTLSLLPYRLLRTIANHCTRLFSSYFQYTFMDRFPVLSKSKNWHIFNFALQNILYVAVILSVGLPLVPLPLSSIPDIFISMSALYIPFFYNASTLLYAGVSKVLDKIYSNDEALEPSVEINHQIMPQDESGIFAPRSKLILFDKHCAQQHNTVKSSNYLPVCDDYAKKHQKIR